MTRDKIVGGRILAKKLAAARKTGKRVVFANGCFDLLHAGHVLLLEEARSLGDLLVVGLNSDVSVKLIKGPSRPVNPERNRAVVLAGLASVDYVVLFDEPTPRELIALLEPDVLVKGEDWRGREVVGRETVEARGGKVVLLPLVPGLSTTGLIDSIKEGSLT